MASRMRFLFPIATILLSATALPSNRRDTAASSVNGKAFDYVIVGGGLTGLVVANRLSELQDRTVLVLENGYISNDISTQVPYLANNINTPLMYNITSAPDPNLGNTSFAVEVGNVVGGGSVVNGMAFDRAAAADYDAWVSLGNKGWGFDDLLPYFKKSTTFTPPLPELVKQFNITWDASYYGTSGPVQASFPHFEYPDTKTVWNSFRAEGVPLPREHASGDAVGAFWIPTDIDPKTETRSHARITYYDPVSARPNLKLLTGQTVNEILFSGSNLTATGVQFVSRQDSSVSKVYAKREVILAAGGVFTPQILQLSGLGPKDVLGAAGVAVKKDFPGVGSNFQDHPNTYVLFDLQNLSFPNPNSLSTNATYNASAWLDYVNNKRGPYTMAHGSSLAFLSLQSITSTYKSIVSSLKAQTSTSFLPARYASTSALLKGYEAQKSIIADLLSRADAAAGEFPMSPSGYALAALGRPSSRGTVTLDPNNKYAPPIVQYNTMQNPVDRSILVAHVRWLRQHWAKPQLSQFSPTEIFPGVQAQTDDEIISALVGAGGIQPSFAHPSGGAAMMPEAYGGVVGSDLLVYGTKGLSVVDASVLPLIPATHLQATMYAVAEKAADLIKARG